MRQRTATFASWRRPTGSGAACSPRSICPNLSTIERRTANIDALYTLLAERMRTRTTAEWRARLDQFDVPNGVVNDLEGLVADPYLRETGFFQRVEHPTEGSLMTTAIPV